MSATKTSVRACRGCRVVHLVSWHPSCAYLSTCRRGGEGASSTPPLLRTYLFTYLEQVGDRIVSLNGEELQGPIATALDPRRAVQVVQPFSHVVGLHIVSR